MLKTLKTDFSLLVVAIKETYNIVILSLLLNVETTYLHGNKHCLDIISIQRLKSPP